MRSMTVFNFLLEATVIGSVIILLVIAVRALLRDRLGSRAIYAAWLLVALRLLLPLSLPNPVMDEFRPGFSVDVAARPVADQVRQRVIDASYSASTLLDGVEGGALEALAQHTSSGVAGKWILLGWLCVALALGGGMACAVPRQGATRPCARAGGRRADHAGIPVPPLPGQARARIFCGPPALHVPDRGGAPLHCRPAGYFAGASVAGAGA